jgi:hypothetical protein
VAEGDLMNGEEHAAVPPWEEQPVGQEPAAADLIPYPAPDTVTTDLAATDDGEESRAPIAAFAGRDDERQIAELVEEFKAADTRGVHDLCGIVITRMERGDLSSLAALRLLRFAKDRRVQLRKATS